MRSGVSSSPWGCISPPASCSSLESVAVSTIDFSDEKVPVKGEWQHQFEHCSLVLSYPSGVRPLRKQREVSALTVRPDVLTNHAGVSPSLWAHPS